MRGRAHRYLYQLERGPPEGCLGLSIVTHGIETCMRPVSLNFGGLAGWFLGTPGLSLAPFRLLFGSVAVCWGLGDSRDPLNGQGDCQPAKPGFRFWTIQERPGIIQIKTR